VAGRPTIDLDAELTLQRVLREAIWRGILGSAHDCSDGGLAVAITESALAGGVGVTCREGVLDHHAGGRDDIVLFGESQSRVVVSVRGEALPALRQLAADAGVPASVLGVVGGGRLRIGRLDVSLEAARTAWEGALERDLFGTAGETGTLPSAETRRA
jgi:phosphoribosylformylglycinamidine synthase